MSPEQISALSLFDTRVSIESFGLQAFDQSHFIDNKILFSPSDASLQAKSKADKVLEWCEKNRVRIVYPGSPFYPEEFLILERPPLFLSLRGEAVWQSRVVISVVGSRDPSGRALAWIDLHLSTLLRKRQDLALVSGGARGVDQRVHAVSLRQKRPTVVFLPSGLDIPYPSEMTDWIPRILEHGGAVLSPYAPDQPVRKQHFEGRNRLIAAISRLCLIVEAKRRSGSLMTARLARDLDRTVCVVPAFPDEANAAGGVDLLFDGALPIRDADDLTVIS